MHKVGSEIALEINKMVVTGQRARVSSCSRCNYYNGYNNNNNQNDDGPNESNNKCSEHKVRPKFGDCSNVKWLAVRATLIAIGSVLTATSAAVAVQGAAVYSNVNFLANPNFEPICNPQQEHFIESDGKESSLILEFTPGVLAEKRKSCTRILSAPSNYGFIVRLILPKIRHSRHSAAAAATVAPPTAVAVLQANEAANGLNATQLKNLLGRTCPLSIFSSHDPHTPQWRVDPCQLEDTAPEMEDPVRLFHGRVRIVWEHGHNTLHSKLMVTALGKGDQCRSENKHQCLKIGDEPILCISKELVCDGIRHCPYSNEYDSDEDYAMCWKRRRYGEPIPPAMETDIFEHFALEVFRNLFAFDVPSLPGSTDQPDEGVTPVNTTTLRKVDAAPALAGNGNGNSNGNGTNANADATPPSADNSTESAGNSPSGGGHHRRNSTRSGLNSDLSKYGPWGYLMLGMLLCGGALLICGLWASASQHAANNEREAALQSGVMGGDQQSGSASPPNYEELDPPPAYSVLFPNQKAASSATLSSMGAGSLVPPTVVVAVTTSGVLPATPPLTPTTPTPPTTTTRVQMESPAASGSGAQQRSAAAN